MYFLFLWVLQCIISKNLLQVTLLIQCKKKYLNFYQLYLHSNLFSIAQQFVVNAQFKNAKDAEIAVSDHAHKMEHKEMEAKKLEDKKAKKSNGKKDD